MQENQAPVLELSGISKRFAGIVALNKVSLSVRAGEVMALVGENGAGKSTLVKTLTGIYTPDEGVVRLAGHSPARRMRCAPGSLPCTRKP